MRSSSIPFTRGRLPCRTRSTGFTLVELLITMAIAAVLLALGVPTFRETIAGGRVTGATNDMVTALATARNEAIRRGTRITMCRSTDGATCSTTAGQGWEVGWIMFVDTTRTSSDAAVDSGETIIGRGAAVPNSMKMLGNNQAAGYVSFAADGTPKIIDTGNALTLTQTIRVCMATSALNDDTRARDITLTLAGRIAASRVTGVAVTCPAA